MSWAALLRSNPAADAAQEAASGAGGEAGAKQSAPSPRVAIVDANAIIGGLRLSGVADRFLTVQEVLDEVRDKQSRQFLAALPFALEVKQPSDESIAAVTAFARLTGDLHALSKPDIKLLALARAQEVATNGDSHLRTQPVQASLKPKHQSDKAKLPGWGQVSNPQDWAAIDALPDEAGGGGASRIRSTVQDLAEGSGGPAGADAAGLGAQPAPTPAPAPPFRTLGEAAAVAAAATDTAPDAGASAWFREPAGAPTASPAAEASQVVLPAPPAAASALLPAGDLPIMPPGSEHTEAGGEAASVATGSSVLEEGRQPRQGEEGEDDGWAVAGCSRAAERRHRRREARWASRHAEWAARNAAEAAAQAATLAPLAATAAPSLQPAAAAAATCADAAGGEDEDEDVSSDEEGGEDDEEGDVVDNVDVTPSHASGTDCGGFEVNSTSSVCCVTADFPMQNVLLQMGLRLVSPEGKQVTRLSRWALRCVACFFVTREAGRLFCPRCGNAALDRVEVSVSPGGAEVFGVRRKHVLRGTRFSLPKPKGGRAANPILREDELLQKVKPRRAKAAQEGGVDPLSADYEWGAWQQQQQQQQRGQLYSAKGAAYLLASHRHNRNEVKPTASNRRRK